MTIEKRTYANPEKAKAVMDELFSQGFSEVKASFKPDRVRVAVNARFGEGQRVKQILDSHEPLASDDEDWGSEDNEFPAAARASGSKVTDWAAPLSSLLGWKVLSDYQSPFWPKALVDDPAPLSTWLNWPVLTGASRLKAPTASAPEADSVAVRASGKASRHKPEPNRDQQGTGGN
jgi:hypothetical protein